MPLRIKLMLAGLTVGIMLASFASSASSGDYGVSRQEFRMTWSRLEFIEASTTIRCAVTMEGSFQRTRLSKTEALAIGTVSRKAVNSCTGGSARIERATPLMTFQSFTGILPNIEEVTIKISLLQMTFSNIFWWCVITTEPSEPAILRVGRDARGNLIGATFNSNYAITPSEERFCVEQWRIGGAGEIHLLGSSTTRITLTLI